jgi:hypothetical protein
MQIPSQFYNKEFVDFGGVLVELNEIQSALEAIDSNDC